MPFSYIFSESERFLICRGRTIGQNVAFQGATTDFSQDVASMQFDHKSIDKAPKGKEIGIKVKKKVREGDMVYLNS